MDPFMGGGTSVIEGLNLGRRVIGIDLNSLACFVTRVRTTPLSANDEATITDWSKRAAGLPKSGRPGPTIRNMPKATKEFLADALVLSRDLSSGTQRSFAKCVLLRLGQWALDGREFSSLRRDRLAARLPVVADEMIEGLRQFVDFCEDFGVTKSLIKQNRRLVCRSAMGLEEDRRLVNSARRPLLVFTSPPYPGVHVLYHRWQHRGRRETSAPYWIASLRDGNCASFYTGGSRTPTGERNYFEMITQAFSSVRAYMNPKGLVVQLVGFSNCNAQLPRYLRAMEAAGFQECPLGPAADRLGRRVPNRKWYARVRGSEDTASEVLLFHRPV